MRQTEREQRFNSLKTDAASPRRNPCGWPRFGQPAALDLRPRQPEIASVLRFMGASGAAAADAAWVSDAVRMAEQAAQAAAPRGVRLFLSGADFERCTGVPVRAIWTVPEPPDGLNALGGAPNRRPRTTELGGKSELPAGVVLYALTLGAPLDAWLRVRQAVSLPHAVAADAAATALLFELEQAARRQILSEIEPFGLALSRPVFPGDDALPLSAQPMICRWLDTHRKMAMGVRPDLTVMEPAKSLTAAARLVWPADGAASDGTVADAPPGHDCRRCAMASGCPFAVAPPASDAGPDPGPLF